jgi:hypothetical protein
MREPGVAYLITDFFAGGTGGALPPGQTYHAAGPTEGGWLVAAV